MAKITFIILAHENADHVADLASLLTAWDPHANAVIHYDLNSPRVQFARLKERTSKSPRIHLVKDRIKCGWGNFSLVDAVVRALRVIRREKIDCDRVMLISGACMPIRPLAELSQFLDAHPKTEFIEAYDSNWMIGGLRNERYQYWHFFNYQTHPRLFSGHYHLQRRFWPKRRFPRSLEARFGSQWWCLSWKLCEKILDYIQKHPLIYFFFSTTWIPDELFFQTMAFRFTPTDNLAKRNLTFFHFNHAGKPIVLRNDHADLLKDVPFFFARKISAGANGLRAHLTEIARQPAPAGHSNVPPKGRHDFPYQKMIDALPKASPLTPPLFQTRNLGTWPDILDNCPQSFAILYGPPQLTRRAADALRQIEGLTVLGRILHPSKVDFGPGRQKFHGLYSDDNRIRDIDIPLYFGRILSRVKDMAVFELCPGDHAPSELPLLQSRNAIVLPVMPERDNDIMRQLYWTLCVGENLHIDHTPTPVATYRSMEQETEARMSAAIRSRTETYLKVANMAAGSSTSEWQAALEFRHGPGVLAITSNIDKVEEAINSPPIEETVAGLPVDWQASVSMLSALHPRWKIAKQNFPVALPELFTASFEITGREVEDLAIEPETRGGAGN